MPNTISATPTPMRSHDAQLGGLFPSPPRRLDTSTKIDVNAARPTSQPARKASPAGLGRGVCSTNTAGMIDSGDNATTSASGMSSVNIARQRNKAAPRFSANHDVDGVTVDTLLPGQGEETTHEPTV